MWEVRIVKQIIFNVFCFLYANDSYYPLCQQKVLYEIKRFLKVYLYHYVDCLDFY